jgi:hypothetical protein
LTTTLELEHSIGVTPAKNVSSSMRRLVGIALIGPTGDYLPVSFSAEAILKDAPHPCAAKLFVTWCSRSSGGPELGFIHLAAMCRSRLTCRRSRGTASKSVTQSS